MSKPTAASFFILSPSEVKSAEFYQALLHGISSYQQLGERLIRLAEQAHAFRQFNRVRECGQVLSNIPIKGYQAVGHYYIALAANSRGNGDLDKDRKMFEVVIDDAPDPYKAKTLLSLGAVALRARDYQSHLRYLVETAKASKDVSTTVRAQLGVVIYKSVEGFHQRALADLENLYRLARHAQPIVFFDYLNSLAVELGEVGRKDEARNVSRIVLASPFAFAYPEWLETAETLRKKNRSFVAVNPSRSGNVLRFWPQQSPSEPVTEKAKILSLAEKLEQRRQAVKRKAEKAFKIRTKILSDDLPESVVDSILRILGITYYD